ncbi:amidohydrolase [Mizugakiibacter sediminis]|uniref:Amidohydrolase n=2 Tax=Mizugakiibacter sediminis TaxID=1475481 RepID=A0A0K8QP05_9GAMM|nr:amidohydrolase [Mizugakiibacter sediminis]
MHGMVPVARGSRGSEPVGVATKWKDRDVRRVEARARRARTALRVAVSLLLACAAGFAARPSRAQETPAKDVTAFVAVNVVPMDRERVLRDRTVLVEDGRIVAIGRKVAVPKGARIVDGAGRAFLSPGLADMHMHADTAEALKVYLANGVTSVLNMGGASPEFVAQLRPAVNAGKRPGPHVYVAFIVDGSPRYGHFFVTTPEEARWAVRLAKTNGYDFIKVYNDLSPACFQALVDEGRAQHLPVVGHGVRSVGLERQLDAGQLMVAHAEEFLYTVFKPRPTRRPAARPIRRRFPARSPSCCAIAPSSPPTSTPMPPSRGSGAGPTSSTRSCTAPSCATSAPPTASTGSIRTTRSAAAAWTPPRPSSRASSRR